MSFAGVPSGTGCPGSGFTAKDWLITKYIAQGYCCRTASPTIKPTSKIPTIVPTVSPTSAISCRNVVDLAQASLVGPIIGLGNNVCKIFPRTSPNQACDYYVKYRYLYIFLRLSNNNDYITLLTTK